jgi:hypothetical protein
LNASLAPEVLLHPVCSKVSSHAFDAHFNVLDLRLQWLHKDPPDKQQERELSPFHVFAFLSGAYGTAA